MLREHHILRPDQLISDTCPTWDNTVSRRQYSGVAHWQQAWISSRRVQVLLEVYNLSLWQLLDVRNLSLCQSIVGHSHIHALLRHQHQITSNNVTFSLDWDITLEIISGCDVVVTTFTVFQLHLATPLRLRQCLRVTTELLPSRVNILLMTRIQIQNDNTRGERIQQTHYTGFHSHFLVFVSDQYYQLWEESPTTS